MEAVIAENPDVTDMRLALALAHRYLDAGEYVDAVRYYLVALDQESRNGEAQAHYGWLLLQIGQPLQVMQAVDGALAQDPQHVEASWFTASIARHGLSDPATTTTVLEQLQQRTDLETEVRSQVDALLGEALQRTAGR